MWSNFFAVLFCLDWRIQVSWQCYFSFLLPFNFSGQPKFNEALLEMFQIDYIGAAPYLSCIPSVLHHHLTSGDRFLVLSSDGLYQYFTNDEVISHVAWFMENVPEGDPAQYLISELLGRAAKKNGNIPLFFCLIFSLGRCFLSIPRKYHVVPAPENSNFLICHSGNLLNILAALDLLALKMLKSCSFLPDCREI
jgi:Protein phosphatase 2C